MISLRFSDEDDLTICKLKGRIDVSNANHFKKDFFAQFLRAHPKRMIINCEEMEYISSFGFRIMIDLLKACEEERTKVILCGFTPDVLRICSIIGFNKLYKIFSTEDQAKEYFRQLK